MEYGEVENVRDIPGSEYHFIGYKLFSTAEISAIVKQLFSNLKSRRDSICNRMYPYVPVYKCLLNISVYYSKKMREKPYVWYSYVDHLIAMLREMYGYKLEVEEILYEDGMVAKNGPVKYVYWTLKSTTSQDSNVMVPPLQ